MVPILFIGCKKEPKEIGKNLVSGEEFQLRQSDTTTVIAYSVLVDSIRTDETTNSILGNLYDPVFGRTSSDIYTQIRLSKEEPDFGSNPVVDSMFLQLQYAGYYGDTLTPMTFYVQRMNDTISLDSNYYNFSEIEVDASLLADYTTNPRPNTALDTISKILALRIPLTTELGQAIIEAPESVLENNETFINYIGGIRISTGDVGGPGQGILLSMNLLSSNSKIDMYYHNDTDTTKFNLSINSLCARFMHFGHNNYEEASSDFQSQVIDGDTTLGQQNLYCQTMAGVKTILRFPYLKNWVKEHKIAINEAQLIVPNAAYDTALFRLPAQLGLQHIQADGSPALLVDQFEGSAYFGGLGNEQGDYRFRITRHLQAILNEKEDNNKIELLIVGGALKASRMVIQGTESEPLKMKLNLIYTVVEEED